MFIFANTCLYSVSFHAFGELAHSVWNTTKGPKTCLDLVNLGAFGELAHSVCNATDE